MMRLTPLVTLHFLVLMAATPALTQGLAVVPQTVSDAFRPSYRAFDTVSLVNESARDIRVDSITIRLLDGGANPRPAEFTACKTCPHDSLYAYNYNGWMYGHTLDRSLRYLRDSLFLIQDGSGVPVSVSLAPGASAPFALHYPVNCPVCGRMPSYPGATRYAFTFIASDGSRAVLNVEANFATAVIGRIPSLERAGPGAAHDAAGRAVSGAGRSIRYPMPDQNPRR